MIKYKVIRPNDTVIVAPLKHKEDNKWSYINITKEHICPCKFDTLEEAIQDMDKLIKQGKIIKYEKI